MATSYSEYKNEVTEYLKEKFDSTSTILDVGAGCGTYYNYLHDHFDTIDAVEVFKPNIDNFELERKYNKVYNVNITDFKYNYYDIIIFGDIIEHLTYEEADHVLKYAYNNCKELLVAVPYTLPQGVVENNIYEIHKQDDLTPELMEERYPYLSLLFSNELYGYYIKKR